MQPPATPQPNAAPGGMQQGMPGESPYPVPVDPYRNAIDVLLKQITATEAIANEQEKTLAADETKSFQRRQEVLEPRRKRINDRIEMMQGKIGTPPIPDLPQWQPGPIVNGDDYQKFGFMLLAMGLIGGIASGGDWLGASASLNGALHGYYKGSIDVAKKAWDDFVEQYNEARDDYQLKLNRYHDIMEDEKLSINGMMQQYQLAADEFNDDMLKFQIRSHDLDHIRAHVDKMDRTLTQLAIAEGRVSMQMGAALSAADAGLVSLGAAGFPMSQLVQGYGQPAMNRRMALQRAIIERIARENNVDYEQAGLILGKRMADNHGAGRSINQQYLQAGATEGMLLQMKYNLGRAGVEIDKLPTSDISPMLTWIARGYEKWTADPKYTLAYGFLYSALTEAARIQVGAGASVQALHEGTREKAEEMMNFNFMTRESFHQGMVPYLTDEATSRVHYLNNEIQLQEERMMGLPLGGGIGGVGAGAETVGAPPAKTPAQQQADDDAQYLHP